MQKSSQSSYGITCDDCIRQIASKQASLREIINKFNDYSKISIGLHCLSTMQADGQLLISMIKPWRSVS